MKTFNPDCEDCPKVGWRYIRRAGSDAQASIIGIVDGKYLMMRYKGAAPFIVYLKDLDKNWERWQPLPRKADKAVQS